LAFVPDADRKPQHQESRAGNLRGTVRQRNISNALCEVVRAYQAAGWLSVRFTSVLTSMAFERLTDEYGWRRSRPGGVVRAIAEQAIRGAEILGAALLAIAALFLLVWFGRGKVRPGSAALDDPFCQYCNFVLAGIFVSSFILILQTLVLWFVIKAPHYRSTLGRSSGVRIVHPALRSQNAPANVGTFSSLWLPD
jgi:hypothetical protein